MFFQILTSLKANVYSFLGGLKSSAPCYVITVCLCQKGDRPERQRRSTMTSSGPWDFWGAMFKGGDKSQANRIYRKYQANGGQYTLRYLSQEFLGTDIFLP